MARFQTAHIPIRRTCWMWVFCIFAVLFSVVGPSRADWSEGTWQFSLSSEQYSDPLTLSQLDGRNGYRAMQARPGLNLMQLDQAAMISYQPPDSEQTWSWVHRRKARLVMNNDTARRIGEIISKNSSAEDWVLLPQIQYRAFAGQGLDWRGKIAGASQWALKGGVQILALNRMTQAQANGQISHAASSQTYGLQLQTLRSDNRLTFPYQDTGYSTGYAVLTQAHVQARIGAWQFRAGFSDVGRLYWTQLPQQVRSYNTSTNTRDANGYLLITPSLEGQNSQSHAIWSAPWSGDVQARWQQTSSTAWVLPWQYVPQFGWLPAIGVERKMGSYEVGLVWRQHQRDAVAQWRWHGLSLMLNMGSSAHSRLWGVSYQLPL